MFGTVRAEPFDKLRRALSKAACLTMDISIVVIMLGCMSENGAFFGMAICPHETDLRVIG
jgi:hypothetical protein